MSFDYRLWNAARGFIRSKICISAEITAHPHLAEHPTVRVTCRHVFPASDVMNMLTLLLVNSAPIEPMERGAEQLHSCLPKQIENCIIYKAIWIWRLSRVCLFVSQKSCMHHSKSWQVFYGFCHDFFFSYLFTHNDYIPLLVCDY